MTAIDPYDEWDAAYVLGALSAADRAEYEDHLADCPRCSAAVTEFAALPGLLGVLPDAEGLALLDESPRGGAVLPAGAGAAGSRLVPEAAVLPSLASRVRRRRRARRIWTGVVAAAAAAAVVGAVLLPGVLSSAGGDGSPSARSVTTLEPVTSAAIPSNPLTATVALTRTSWGTRVDMTCSYARASSSASSKSYDYGLYVTDATGKTTLVSTWSAGPGSTAKTVGSISTPAGELTRLQIKEQSSGVVLLARGL
jgi:hypothetical protein